MGQADNDATICDEPSCRRHFNYWTRRHHCRKCGNIFCDSHSSYDVPLDQDANYNPRGTPSRACSHCHTDFEVWRSRTNSAASSDDSSSNSSGTAPASPITASGTPTAIGNPGRASLAAVMDPPVTSELYFVASGGGGPSMFSSTLEQHNAKVAKLRAWEKAHPQATTTTRTVVTRTITAPAGSPLREHR